MTHEIIRVRRETRLRTLAVREVVRLTPHMLRVELEGDDLADFDSGAPDDHVKLFFPTGEGEPEKRDYTPRRFSRQSRSLTLDFALHDAGPATDWARTAKPGDILRVGGPRGSALVPESFDWFLLVGDETALPAIGRWVEELPPGKPVTTLVAVPGASDEQAFSTQASHKAVWVHRPPGEADNPQPLMAALSGFEKPAGDGFVWIAAEAAVAHALRDFVLGPFGHPAEWMRSKGYWQKG